MSDIIRFLERMGGDAQWRHAPGDIMEAALSEAELDPEHGAALLAGDSARLHALLGCAPFMVVQLPGQEEEEEQEDEGEGEDAPQPDSARQAAAFA